MEPRVSLITLGVADLARARRFYEEGLGWRTASPVDQSVVFFQAGALIVGLWGKDDLAEDAGIAPATDGFGAIALAQNVRSREAVDQVLEEAKRAGGRILKPAEDTFWGGYSGYFADPDGHVWEIAWNPGFTITDDGATLLPG
jgi:catechol 2,3-dioxygenase-like lactoylglutathione lyase family enzyme